MKRSITLLAILFSLLTSIDVFSQTGVSVYDNSGNLNLFSIHNIDSITFEGIERFTQKVWTNGIVIESSVDEVKEVSLIPNGKVYQFENETLGNWDDGFLIDSMYVSYKEDTENGDIYYFFNNINDDNNKGLIIQFGSDNELKGIMCNGQFCAISIGEGQMLLSGFDEEGVYEESISIEKPSSSSMRQKRASSEPIPLFDNLMKTKDYWGYIQTAKSLGADFRDRQWINFFRTIAITAGESGIGKMLEGAAGRLSFLAMAPYEMVKGSVEQCNKRNAATIYGNSSIEITEIRKGSDGRVEVYVTVKDANTIPNYLFRYYEPEKNEKTKNNVFGGVIGRSAGLPTVQLHTKGYESTEVAIPTDGTVSTLYYTFFLPDIPLGQTYKFRPYLKSTRIKNIWGGVDEWFIRYGNSVDYTGFNGKITNFWQYRADYGVDASGFGFVSFGTEVTAEISSADNVEEWGVYVSDLNGNGVNDLYPSEFRAAKLTDKIDIDFNINMDEFDEVNQNVYTKKVMLGVYQKMNNPTGTYDYLTYYYSEPQEYELVYEAPKTPAKITNFEVNSASFIRDGFEYKNKTYYYDYAATTTVELESSEGVEDWGYVYKAPDGETIHISVKDLGTNADSRYDYYRTIPKSTATLYGYAKYGEDNYVYEAPKEYPLEYIFHPTAYVSTVIADSITTISAQFEYGFDDVPRTGKCYIAYQAVDEDEPKIEQVSYTEKDTIKVSDLYPATTYNYWAYVEYAGETYMDLNGKKSFTTLTPSAYVKDVISGTITASSAQFEYGFSNVPDDGTCYISIQADGVDEIEAVPVSATDKDTYTASNLQPDTKYSYWAYIEYKGKTYADFNGKKTFTTLAPTATTGESSNITHNSAIVECAFANVPEGGVCGVEYTWNGGSISKSVNITNGSIAISLSGLKSNTEYTYCAYVEVNGKTYYGADKTFTTLTGIPDLSGTWSCTTYNDDGSVLETATLTLTSDKRATSKTTSGSSFIPETETGSWSISSEGKVGIVFSWTGGSSYHPVWYSASFTGYVSSLSSPSSIEGTVYRAWASTSEHGNVYKFKMTR